MKKVILLIVLLVSGNLFAQTIKRRSINVGLCRTDLFSKLYIRDIYCDEGCYATEQYAATCFSFNFLYQLPIGKKWFIPLGVSLNQKGYSENGFSNDGSGNWEPYSKVYTATYLGFYCGISYDLILSKNLTLNIGQLLNPELIGRGNASYPISISTRTNLSFQFNSSKKIGLQVTPFFETSLHAYSKSEIKGEDYYWRPFGYGLTIGISW